MVKCNPHHVDRLVTVGIKHIRFWQQAGIVWVYHLCGWKFYCSWEKKKNNPLALPSLSLQSKIKICLKDVCSQTTSELWSLEHSVWCYAYSSVSREFWKCCALRIVIFIFHHVLKAAVMLDYWAGNNHFSWVDKIFSILRVLLLFYHYI